MTAPAAPAPSLEALVARLPHPTHQLLGRRGAALALPDNIVCFQRNAASELNKPRQGRALHHRFVLIFALRGSVSVSVDDRVLPLHPDEGLLVFPFQFHHYAQAARDEISWLFVTFDLPETGSELLESLRFRPFVLTPEVRALAAELIAAYQADRAADLPALLLGLLLARLRRLERARTRASGPLASPGIVMKINQLAHRSGDPLGIKQMARALGISSSHLRARFRASCGVSLGRHLRRLRLEKACGLLRLTPNRISEIADQCAFNSIYSFSRAFRAAFGVSPLAYRHAGRPAPRRSGSAAKKTARSSRARRATAVARSRGAPRGQKKSRTS